MKLRTLIRAIASARPKFRRPGRNAKPRDIRHVAILRRFRPDYWGPYGLERATLHKIDVSPVNGEVVAYYDVRGHRYLWRVVNGVPREIRRYQKRR